MCEDKGIESDIKRDEYLSKLGIRVKRYSNVDINKRFDAVCRDIMSQINTSSVTS